MDVAAAALGGLVGLVAGGGLGLLTRRRRSAGRGGVAEPAERAADGTRSRVLDLLQAAVVVVDASDEVTMANDAARTMEIVRGQDLAVDELRHLARRARRGTQAQEVELELPRRTRGHDPISVRARGVPLGGGDVALLVDDLTEAQRLAVARRDFVANVSHELKTPVGAISLLAEAIREASGDPEAVGRFSGRLSHESDRLTRLVQGFIDLSRLEGADPLPEAQPIVVDAVVAEAVDRARLAADRRGIELVVSGSSGTRVLGVEGQLVSAVSNLLDNAVTHSPDRARVVVATRAAQHDVEVSVTDQGTGIAEADRERLFERFYRADPARSRGTGGSGLGLAIVKHVVTNHGGECTVWSSPGAGSTFTIRLPRLLDEAPPSVAAAAPNGRRDGTTA